MHTRLLLPCAAALACASSASAQRFLLVPDSTADRISLYSPVDGSLVNTTFIADAGGTPFDFSTPKDAIQVNNEIWVIDQLTDQIVRFDTAGTHIATILPATVMVDNMRGSCFANNTFYVSTDGTANGSANDTVVMFDTAGARIGSFSTVSSASTPFDLIEYNGELLLSNFVASNIIGRYSFAGAYLGAFHTSAGVTDVDSPEQLNVAANGDVLAQGFGDPDGTYRYDSTGALVATYLAGNFGRGCFELDNGNILFTDGAGIYVYDIGLNTATQVTAGTGFQYINLLDLGPTGPVSYCTAGTTTNGCLASISATNNPSLTQANPCVINVGSVEGQKTGIIFYGLVQSAVPWGTGSSFLCIKAPTQRTPSQPSNGTINLCDGSMSLDWDAYQLANPTALGQPWALGNKAYVQAWFRDPPAPKTTSLSDGIELTYVP